MPTCIAEKMYTVSCYDVHYPYMDIIIETFSNKALHIYATKLQAQLAAIQQLI